MSVLDLLLVSVLKNHENTRGLQKDDFFILSTGLPNVQPNPTPIVPKAQGPSLDNSKNKKMMVLAPYKFLRHCF